MQRKKIETIKSHFFLTHSFSPSFSVSIFTAAATARRVVSSRGGSILVKLITSAFLQVLAQ